MPQTKYSLYTPAEFLKELDKTEERITRKDYLGEDFSDFEVLDLDNNRLSRSDLIGKILVINFWFIGCAPCEMERPSLNELRSMYEDDEDVVFISFAKNNSDQLKKFLSMHPVLYQVVPTQMDYIKTNFNVNEFAVNIIVDGEGKYFFNSAATGIGIRHILQQHIEKAKRK